MGHFPTNNKNLSFPSQIFFEVFGFFNENKGKGTCALKIRVIFIFIVSFMTWSKKFTCKIIKSGFLAISKKITWNFFLLTLIFVAGLFWWQVLGIHGQDYEHRGSQGSTFSAREALKWLASQGQKPICHQWDSFDAVHYQKAVPSPLGSRHCGGEFMLHPGFEGL